MKRQYYRSSLSGRTADGPKRVPRGVPKTQTLTVTSTLDHNTAASPPLPTPSRNQRAALSPPPPSPSPSRNQRYHPNAGLSIDTFQARQDHPTKESTPHALFEYPQDDPQTVVGALSSPTQSLPDSCSTPLSASTLSRSSTTSTTCTDDTNYSIQAQSSCGHEGDAQSPVRLTTTTSAVLPRSLSAPLFTLYDSYIPEEPSEDINPCPPSDLGATTVAADLQEIPRPSFFVFDSPISTPTTPSSSTSDPFNTLEGYSLAWSADSNRSLKRLHALHELLETERAYVRDLRILVEIYLTPLLSRAWLSSSHARSLARNAADLLQFHKEFLAELEEARRKGEGNVRRMSLDQREGIRAVAVCFVKAEPKFGIYTEYCLHHDTALAVANEQKGKAEWVAFMKECANELRARTGQASRLHFTDYLIKPVQRICQYYLLLKELVRPTPDLALERSDLRTAAEAMRRVVERIDAAKSRREAEARTERFWSRVEDDGRFPRHCIRQLGSLVISGALSMVPHGTCPLKPKYYGCFVFSAHMIIVRARRAMCYEPRHWFPLGPCEIRILGEGEGILPNSWILQSPEVSFEFGASSLQERRLWIRYLRDTISLAKFASAPSLPPAFCPPSPNPLSSNSAPVLCARRPVDSTTVAKRDSLLPRPLSAPSRKSNSIDLFRREKVTGVVPPSRKATVDMWLEDVTTVECLAVKVWKGWGEESVDKDKGENGDGELGFRGGMVEPAVTNNREGENEEDIKMVVVMDVGKYGTETRSAVERIDEEGTIMEEPEAMDENNADVMLLLVQKDAEDRDEVNKFAYGTVVSVQDPVLDHKSAESHQSPSTFTANDTESTISTVELTLTTSALEDSNSSTLTVNFISSHLDVSEPVSAPASDLESRLKKSLFHNVFDRLTRLKGRRSERHDHLVAEEPVYIAESPFAKVQEHLLFQSSSSTPLPARTKPTALPPVNPPPSVNPPHFCAHMPLTFDGSASSRLSLDLYLVGKCRKKVGEDADNRDEGNKEWQHRETAGSNVKEGYNQSVPHLPITGVASSALRRGRSG